MHLGLTYITSCWYSKWNDFFSPWNTNVCENVNAVYDSWKNDMFSMHLEVSIWRFTPFSFNWLQISNDLKEQLFHLFAA